MPEGLAAGTTGQRGLRVALDARLEDGRAGGVQQYVIGLASALCALEDSDDAYLFLGRQPDQGWLLPYIGGGGRLLDAAGSPSPPRLSATRRWRQAVGNGLPSGRALARWVTRAGEREHGLLASSDGTVENHGVDVVHFTFQGAFTTEVPSIYQPWDLQHVHLPEYFTADELRWRETAYRRFSDQADLVVVATDWARRDMVRYLGLSPSKVAVVEVPPVVRAYPIPDVPEIERIRVVLDLPPRFAYYPAQTWPHKNHIRLLEALSVLRDRDGVNIDLVCSGVQNAHFSEIDRVTRRLGLTDQVRFLGYVGPVQVQAVYRLARLLIFPSLFEGWGLPIVEAFSVGLPVACSNVTSLPDTVEDAALLFDPRDVDSVATALRALWEDDALAAELRERGRQRASRLDWGYAARTLRAHYRLIGQRVLTSEDRALIERSMPNASR